MLDMRCYFGILLILLCFSCSKNDREIYFTMKSFVSSEIELPSELMQICKGNIDYKRDWHQPYTYVVYYSPDDCSECEISHLYEMIPLFKLSGNNTNMEVAIIFSPSEKDMASVIAAIIKSRFEYPIYIDINQVLQQGQIPKDRKFHFFLLDEANHPVLTGNVLASEKLMRMLKRKIVTSN